VSEPIGRARAKAGRIARWLIRGPDAPHILEDLAELRARDIARGVPRWRAWLRHARNLVGSAWAVRRRPLPRLRAPAGVWLDVKLAARLLRKQPGLTVVTCIVFAIGIPVALAPFQLVAAINGPLPFDRAKDLLAIEYWDQAAGDQAPVFAQDFETWRESFDSFDGLGAFRSGAQNLVGDDGRAELVRGSEMTASVFGLLRVKPLLGRMLVEADERPGAQPVVVIGYDLWQTRFGGDPAAIGQSVRLGRTRRTVVGVMPRGFLFPLREAFPGGSR
jgi:hypothetical protein